MSSPIELSADAVQQLRKNPVHTVLFDLGQAAKQFNVHKTEAFKKLIAYVMETADGRDRREPWIQQPGVARPVPKLRVAIDACFDVYGDLQWFRMNKTTNKSGQPLIGLFPRMAASLARVKDEDFGAMIEALVAPNPDAAIQKMLQECGGRLPNVGLSLFSQLAYAFRRDLFFVIRRDWAEANGMTRFVGNDMRRYAAVSRSLREVCDSLNIPRDLRGSILDRFIETESGQINPTVQKALSRSLGPKLARFAVLEPNQALSQDDETGGPAAQPLEFAARAIRARRGSRRLRNDLIRAYGSRCAVSGDCIKDLIEVAYIVPFPTGSMHDVENAIPLRSDIHTLWDLNLIGVNPETLRLQVSQRLTGTTYEKLSNRQLIKPREGHVINQRLLRERWIAFQEGLQSLNQRKRGVRTMSPSALSSTAAIQALSSIEKPVSNGSKRQVAKVH